MVAPQQPRASRSIQRIAKHTAWRRLGISPGLDFTPRTPAPSFANLAASPVRSSEWLGIQLDFCRGLFSKYQTTTSNCSFSFLQLGHIDYPYRITTIFQKATCLRKKRWVHQFASNK